MPDVGSNQFRAANSAGNFVSGIPMGKNGTTGGPNNDGWKYGYAVYAHNGTTWVEVWNARPEVVSTSMATTSTGLTFSGTADPNNFATTAKFEYKEVGAGSYSDSGTTTTGMGDGIDGAVSYTVTATVADTYKNWESRASGTNTGGTGTGSTITLDCRKHNAGGSGWTETASYDASGCDSCGTKTLLTYTKSGCQSYNTGYSACSGSWVNVFTGGTYTTSDGVTATYVTFSDWLGGFSGYLALSTCGQGQCGCLPDERQAWPIEQCSVTGVYRRGSPFCVRVAF